MSHSVYPPLMQRTSWTLAVPFKEQHHHRGPSDSIANNYSLMARDLKLKDLQKIYQPGTITVPRDRTEHGMPSGNLWQSMPVYKRALRWNFPTLCSSPGSHFFLQLTLGHFINLTLIVCAVVMIVMSNSMEPLVIASAILYTCALHFFLISLWLKTTAIH